ncbi:hypothetical protein AVEN_91169-1 [Araneus ventricosus]|uniref:Uncharacterized protein n=1 Tax=Araneus ventricosus TaxID=182803 RepID=A0A4Y2E3Z2_ARAVE|nr:hypothetical protein AVEN_91169-1 [Araneus ventricosus]
MDSYLNDFHEATPLFSTVEEIRILNDVKKKYQNECFQLKERCPISKLWVQYLDTALLLKEFIRTWRMDGIFVSNKEDDSICPCHMTCFCTPKVTRNGKFGEHSGFKKFTVNFFTIKRSEKCFSGISNDIVIEQSLMKSSKMQGGFVHERSAKESVLLVC